jgi:hypothetical protein
MGAHKGSDKIANTDHFGTFHHCQPSQLSKLPSSQSQNKISQRTKVFAVTVLCKRSKTGNISFLSALVHWSALPVIWPKLTTTEIEAFFWTELPPA